MTDDLEYRRQRKRALDSLAELQATDAVIEVVADCGTWFLCRAFNLSADAFLFKIDPAGLDRREAARREAG